MSDIEILGRPLYRPVKHQLKEEQSPLVQPKSEKSKKNPHNTDIVYERDESDWWWCEDV